MSLGARVVSEQCGMVSLTTRTWRLAGAAAWASISAGVPAASHPPTQACWAHSP